MSLPDILEAEFGQIETGIKVTGFPNVQIIRYHSDSTNRISTLGLHRWRWGDAQIWFEWYSVFELDRSADQMASALDYALQRLLSGKMKLPMQGDWITLPEPVRPEFDSSALYFTSQPVKQVTRDFCEGASIALASVFPISFHDIAYIENEGWEPLEIRWASS